ncbi:hypothetical protein L2E82_12334 [Cichorium intybus]|uniref:Uncharacterized protein n=1 Tax=Cichorium intybus TaxID=13427 RepID=A0ACB9GFJ1_CICIN|nr:hypothetical protein L2E82_12334 [Cichorium intybus]
MCLTGSLTLFDQGILCRLFSRSSRLEFTLTGNGTEETKVLTPPFVHGKQEIGSLIESLTPAFHVTFAGLQFTGRLLTKVVKL